MMRIFLILVLLACNPCFSQADLNTGLQAYYPFNGNANDESGNKNNPVFNNATLTKDKDGNLNSAYHFNGINTYMRIPDSRSLKMGIKMSIALKVKPMGFYRGQCYNNMMVMKGDNDYLPGNYFIRFSDVYTGCTDPKTTEERFYGEGTVAAQPIVKLNQWYNVVWTYDGTTAKLYVDCVLREKIVITLGPFTSNYDLFIGRLNHRQYPYWLNGDLDEIRIYNRALNQEEVNLYGQCPSEPMSMDFYTRVINNKKINLYWNTKDELSVRNYLVERSTTNRSDNFVTIGSVSSNKSSNTNKYIFTDKTAKPNILYYYKLIINNDDETNKFSQVKTGKIIQLDTMQLPVTKNQAEERVNAQTLADSRLISEETNIKNVPADNQLLTYINDATSATEVLKRKNDVLETIYFKTDSIEISLFDNAEIDGDTVSVLMNGKIILAKQLLNANATKKMIFIPTDTDSIQLVMYAENLGSIPPNTGLLVVRDGKERHEVHFSGDTKKNAMIILRRKKGLIRDPIFLKHLTAVSY